VVVHEHRGGPGPPLGAGPGPDGYPVMYESAPLMPEYLALVTANFTQEIFQPDEILAQNFVLAANQPSLDILSFMNQTLSANRGSS